MEYALEDWINDFDNLEFKVLILVLMEYALEALSDCQPIWI